MRLRSSFCLVSSIALCAACSGGAGDPYETPADPSAEEGETPSGGETPPEPGEKPAARTPEGFPLVPEPKSADDFSVPDQSEIFELTQPIAGKNVDFAPLWKTATLTWDVDIQTQYKSFGADLTWRWTGDPPGDYWNGTAPNTELVFENGAVDLRAPTPKSSTWIWPTHRYEPMPKRLSFIEAGEVLDEPYNPAVEASSCFFQFHDAYETKRFTPCVFVGYTVLDVEDGFNQKEKRRAYYVAATRAPKLTNEVFIKRERFWERVELDGAKSVRVDPGFTKTVSYTRTQGMSETHSSSFAEATSIQAGLSYKAISASVSHTLTETFESSRTVNEETSLTVTHEIASIEEKSVIFSVWRSVERYTIVDQNGEPYTDPNYTFEPLGSAEIRGDHEVLQSAVFDYQ